MHKHLPQGKSLSHPLRPVLVHFQTGLFLLSLLLDLINLIWLPSKALLRGSFYTMAFALGMAVAAVVTGLVDWLNTRDGGPARRAGIYHVLLNLAVVLIFAVNLSLRYGMLEQAELPLPLLILSLVGVVLLMVSDYLSATMFDADSSAVRHQRRSLSAFERTISVSAQGSPDGFVAIADAASLGEGETLRAVIDGCVAAIVRLDGQLYAFQDFCTHRYGPLSEGAFHNGQVMCPWHRSCFDVRTGRVTQGPASVNLNVYEVEERNGTIYARVHRRQPLRAREVGS
ncbi:MAG: hypothetical protein KatS3mg057_2532 [Herpetosiphonaceae bacterium]|nr:MAG: hypothetical protein KatS3mg057_2532 [Herpetosiphonaceae bacterium]